MLTQSGSLAGSNGPRQVKALIAAAEAAGVRTRYLELTSTKGHDAFLVEWDQLTDIVRGTLPDD